MLPPTIPLFPLPNVVLFPNVFLPLHIFEARYRAMVSEALGGDRIIGMVLLKPRYEANDEEHPPVFAVGCAGVITHAEPLGDGRFNIVLRGIERFRITGEDGERRVSHRSGRRAAGDHPRGAWRGAAPAASSARGAAGSHHRTRRIGTTVSAGDS